MVSRHRGDHPRAFADRESETRWEKLTARHAGNAVPVALLLAVLALMVYGVYAPR